MHGHVKYERELASRVYAITYRSFLPGVQMAVFVPLLAQIGHLVVPLHQEPQLLPHPKHSPQHKLAMMEDLCDVYVQCRQVCVHSLCVVFVACAPVHP